MPLSALVLVLLAGLIHASWNIAVKRAGGDARFAFFTGVWLALVWAPVGAWAAWGVVHRWGALEWAVVAASGLVHVAYYVTLMRGYRAADLTVVYPVARGSGPLLSATAAVLLLGERLSALGVAGIAGVAVGVFLVAGGPGLWRAGQDPARRARVLAGVRWGAATGLFIAGYTVLDGWAVKVLLLSPILVDYLGNFVRLAVLAPVVWRDRPAARALWRTQWRAALFVGAISPVSYVMVLYAVQQAPLSHVAPAREVSMLFAALLGGHLLGEGDRLARLAGAGCIAVGVAALALG